MEEDSQNTHNVAVTEEKKYMMEYFIDQKAIQNERLIQLDQKCYDDRLHCSLASLVCQSNGQVAYGTGVLISPNLILTSSHNLYHKTNGLQGKIIEYQSIRYLLAGYGPVNQKDYKSIKHCKYQIPHNFEDQALIIKHDYALLRLEKEELDYYKCLELTVCCLQCPFPKDKHLKIYGYPVNTQKQLCKNYKNFNYGECQLSQWGSQSPNRNVKAQFNKFRVIYKMTTYGGQSGTAVFYDNNFIAVHKGCRQSEQFNFGRIITLQMLEKLVQWTIQMRAKSFRINDRQLCQHLKKDIRILQKKLIEHQKQMQKQTQEQFLGKIKDLNKKNQQIGTKYNNQKIQLITQIQQLKTQKQQFRAEKQIDKEEILSLKSQLFQVNANANAHNNINYENVYQIKRIQQNLCAIIVRSYINIKTMKLSTNFLTKIDLSMNKQLVRLQLYNNHLISIDLSKNTQLVHLNLENNRLTSIDLSKNTKIASLSIHENNLLRITLWFNHEMPWNFKDSKFGLLLYNQHSEQSEVTFLYKQQHEALCQAFRLEGENGFRRERTFLQKLYRKFQFLEGQENYWENKQNCKYIFTKLREIKKK